MRTYYNKISAFQTFSPFFQSNEKFLDKKEQTQKQFEQMDKYKKNLEDEVQRLKNLNASKVKLAEGLKVKLDQKTITLNMYKENVSRFQEEKELHLKEMTELLKVSKNLDEIKDDRTFLSFLI